MEIIAMPNISIIIPAHNPGIYLRKAIDSIYMQTYSDWEIVVVDDNSTQDLSWINHEFPKVKMIRQEHGGVSVARNNGILNSTGEYIAFMDQDDVWLPCKLERQVAAMESAPDIAVCYCDLALINADGAYMASQDVNKDISEFKSDSNAETVFIVELDNANQLASDPEVSRIHQSIKHFSSRFVVPSTVMLRRQCLATSGLLDPFIPFSGDYDLLIKLGARHKVVRIPYADVLYRKHENNFSDQYEVGRREVDALVARYSAYAKSQGDPLLARNAKKLFGRPSKMYAAQAFDNARRSLEQRDSKALVHHLWRAFLFNPVFVVASVSRWCFAKCTGKAAIN